MKYVIFLFVVILAVVRFSIKFENGIYKLKVTIFLWSPTGGPILGGLSFWGFASLIWSVEQSLRLRWSKSQKMWLLFSSFFNRLSISLQDTEKSLRNGKNYYIPFTAATQSGMDCL